MKKYAVIFCLLLLPNLLLAQRILDGNNNTIGSSGQIGGDNHKSLNRKDSDKEKEKPVPVGLRTWTVSRFNEYDSVAVDTFSHQFQNTLFTEGVTGHYNTLGNLGSPRQSHIFTDRPYNFSYFIFAEPYDFFIRPFSAFHFTNTLSPITNITYHETLSSDNGEDHINAKYAVNANKDIGLGFNLHYLYGRGYYDHQNTSQFNATLYSSVIKEKYQAHLRLFSNYLKTAENGGITDDDYVDNPQNFPSKFETKDIPTNLTKVWNKMYVNGVNLTHSYSLGYYKSVQVADTAKTKKKNAVPKLKIVGSQAEADSIKLAAIAHKDSLLANDSLAKKDGNDSLIEQRIFVPVTSIVHTLTAAYNQRRFIANEDLSGFFTNDYLAGDSALDKIEHMEVSNLLALDLREGFNKWAMAGIRLFAQYDYNHYKLPLTLWTFEKYNENRLTLGGMLYRRKGKHVNYNLLGQTSSDGTSWGEFELRGEGDLRVKLLGDSVSLNVHGHIANQQPTFFYRHYQSKYAWWDNNLEKQFKTRIGATLSSQKTKTKLSLDVENIKNYTYFGSTLTEQVSGTSTVYTWAYQVQQASDDIQLLSLVLNQNFKLGILNWENELAYQTTTDEKVLPLPKFSAYSNLYLLFRIAKVLRVEFGGDVRYFTSYYAPTYSAPLGMFANQPDANLIKVGNHPIVNVYANFHLKHTRFYIMYSHVNYSSDGGSGFTAPHYPVNPGMIKIGLSWNFFN